MAKDVCEILGISNSRDAVTRLDEDDTLMSVIPTPVGNRTVSIVNEFGLYSLALTSRKPEAEKFKLWVTSEVMEEHDRKLREKETPSQIRY